MRERTDFTYVCEYKSTGTGVYYRQSEVKDRLQECVYRVQMYYIGRVRERTAFMHVSIEYGTDLYFRQNEGKDSLHDTLYYVYRYTEACPVACRISEKHKGS